MGRKPSSWNRTPLLYSSTNAEQAQLSVSLEQLESDQSEQRAMKSLLTENQLQSQGDVSPQRRSGGCRLCCPAALWSRRISWPRWSPASPRRRLDRDSGSRWLGPAQKAAVDCHKTFYAWSCRHEHKREQKLSYAVQFIADDLAVAFVVVSVGHRVLQRPEQGVEHLHAHKQIGKVNTCEVSTDKTKQRQQWFYNHIRAELGLFYIKPLVAVSEMKLRGCVTSQCNFHTVNCRLCHLEVFLAVKLHSSVLWQTTGSVLQRGEDSGGDIDVVALWGEKVGQKTKQDY